jgi:Tfp pilus assembly protein PilF
VYVLCAGLAALCSAADPAEFRVLDTAYRNLSEKHYEDAIQGFQEAMRIAPQRADIRKNLGYTLLKIGETVAARESFHAAMALDPADRQLALEYAFLANETGQMRQARRVFLQFRDRDDTAAKAFSNIDGPLETGIVRWQAVIAAVPSNFSAHEEVARLAETRDQLALAIAEYEAAWQLKPDRRDLLVELGRLLQEGSDLERAMTVLLAASRGPDPRTAERARRLMPDRYPFVYEFRNAIAFDRTNTELRRELGYLLIAMGNQAGGQRELDSVTPAEPVLKDRSDPPSADVRTMGFRSFEAGYLEDATHYLNQAIEQDPLDFEAMLKLAWTYNLLQQDKKAIPWFALAAKSPDPDQATEARKAWKGLTPTEQPTQTSVWVYPTFSTRWHAGFGYAQWKSDFKLPFGSLRTYVSTRLVGDSRGAIRQPGIGLSQYLSESSIIPAVGITTNTWRGMRAWAEAGVAWSYLSKLGQRRTTPDYRGGLAMVRSYGSLIGASSTGVFREHEVDALYVHRFNKTFLVNVRNRIGLTVPTPFIRLQFTWNANVNADPRRQYWANFVETGPGFRFRLPFMPPSMLLSADAVHGVYLTNAGNPRRPNFNDFRVGVWYSVSH